MISNPSPLSAFHRIYCIKHTKWGEKRVQLCNFTATITEQITKDDGLLRKIHYLIKSKLADGTPLPDFIVPADAFGSMSWVAEKYGARAIVTDGQGSQDHIRAAIQFLSHDISDRSIYTHTGWRTINGEWYYLTISDALGANGMVEDVEVEIEGKYKHYSLSFRRWRLMVFSQPPWLDIFSGWLRNWTSSKNSPAKESRTPG